MPGPPGPAGVGLDAPLYVPGKVYREGAIVQHAFGQLFVAAEDTADHPKKSERWKRIGYHGLHFTGIKDQKRAYQPGDLFIDGGSCFITLPDGKPKMFVQRGRDGKDGAPGIEGKRGRDGASIVAGVERDGEGIEFKLDDGTSFLVTLPQMFEKADAELRHFHFRMLKDPEYLAQMTDLLKRNLGEEILVDDTTVPITAHRGVWLPDKSYRVGDAVGYGRGLYLCVKGTRPGQPMTEEYWRKLAGSGGGGGGGGGNAALTTIPPLLAPNNQANHFLYAPGGSNTQFLAQMEWFDARQIDHIVWDLAERDALIDPKDLTMGSQVRVLSTLSTYMYMGSTPQGQKVWYEANQIPDHSVTDQVQRLEYDPTRPIGDQLTWIDDRPTAEVVPDLAALYALQIERLVAGKLVYVQSEGMLYEYKADVTTHTGTMADWAPLAGGLTIVGRQGDLPDPTTETIVHGQMFLIQDDFSGDVLERLVVWDENIAARTGSDPGQIKHNEARGLPQVGTPTVAEVQLYGMPMPQVANATATVALGITTDTTPRHQFTYTVQPGDTLHDIAAGLAAAYDQSGSHDPDTIAQAIGDTIYFTGSPGRVAQSRAHG